MAREERKEDGERGQIQDWGLGLAEAGHSCLGGDFLPVSKLRAAQAA